jgi:hypothetical protein
MFNCEKLFMLTEQLLHVALVLCLALLILGWWHMGPSLAAVIALSFLVLNGPLASVGFQDSTPTRRSAVLVAINTFIPQAFVAVVVGVLMLFSQIQSCLLLVAVGNYTIMNQAS